MSYDEALPTDSISMERKVEEKHLRKPLGNPAHTELSVCEARRLLWEAYMRENVA